MADSQTAISKRALLSRLETGGWQGSAIDKDVTQEVHVNHGAAEKAGKYTKYLLNPDALKEVRQVRRDVRDHHLEVTLPWQDTWRLLPVAAYAAYKERMGAFESAMVIARQELAGELPQWKEEARQRLGDLYHDEDYPTADDLAARWTVAVEYAQVPDAKHFIADVAAEERAEISANIQAQIEARVSGAVADLYGRIAGVVDWAMESLDKAKFSGALHKRIMEICDLVPSLNITGDPALTAIVARLRGVFADVDPAALRGKAKTFDAETQTEVTDAMTELRQKMAGYMPAKDGE